MEKLPTLPLQRSHKIAINQYINQNSLSAPQPLNAKFCKKAMMNINTGQREEENWEWEGASGYNTPQHVSPGADVQRNSRAEAEGKTACCRPAEVSRHQYVFRGRNRAQLCRVSKVRTSMTCKLSGS